MVFSNHIFFFLRNWVLLPSTDNNNSRVVSLFLHRMDDTQEKSFPRRGEKAVQRGRLANFLFLKRRCCGAGVGMQGRSMEPKIESDVSKWVSKWASQVPLVEVPRYLNIPPTLTSVTNISLLPLLVLSRVSVPFNNVLRVTAGKWVEELKEFCSVTARSPD